MNDDHTPHHDDPERSSAPPTDRPAHIARRVDAEAGRRMHPRYRVDVEAALWLPASWHAGLCENLSLGGAFVSTHAELPPVGAAIEVWLHLPTAPDPVEVTASVAWVCDEPPPSTRPRGIGVCFDTMADQAHEAVSAFLGQR